jgi:type IV fimbrial biogenesis protein FimT
MRRRRSDRMLPGATKRACKGFTLLELLTTVTVAGILLSVGVPSFFDTIRSNRAATNANEIVGALMIARSEAIRRGARVSLCRSANGTTCSGTWADGWIAFVDGAATDTANPIVADVLRVWPAPAGQTAIAASRDWVRFMPRGNTNAAAAFDLVIGGCRGQQARTVQVNLTGRTSVASADCP